MRAYFPLVCTVVIGSALGSAHAYNHTSYNQTGLVIQYDGADNGTAANKLVNLGTAGSDFDLAACTANDYVSEGIIAVGHLDAGDNKPHGWAYSSAATTAAGDGSGWTIEYVGARSGGESKNGYSYVVGLDNGSNSGRLLYLASGQNDDTSIGAEAMAGGYNYEGTSFVKGANKGAENNSTFATRTVTLDATTKAVVFYENGVKIGEGTTAGSTMGGVKRINIGDMRKGRAYGWWEGSLKSVRIYSRVLSADEVKSNYAIDGYRFYGKVSAAGQLVIANNPEKIGAPTPAAGVQSPESGATLTCSATEAYVASGTRYVATGYTLETSTDGGDTWSTPVSYEGTSYAYVNKGVTTRLTWQWSPTHYRLYVNRNGGAETFLFSPAPTFEDTVDTTTPGGYYASGTEVSVTANTMTTPVVSTFSKWTGDAGESTANPLVLTVNGITTVKANFDRPWYLATRSTGSGYSVYYEDWELAVSSSSVDGVTGLIITDCISGSGVLDMSTLNKSLLDQEQKPVVAINEYGLDGLSKLTGLILPSKEACETGIQVMGKWAFANNSNLAGPIDLWSVTKLSENVFLNCGKLSGDLILPSLTTIGDRTFKATAFKGDILAATNLTTCTGQAPFTTVSCKKVWLPKLAEWPTYMFYGCSGITNIVVGSNFTKFGSKIFSTATFPFATIEMPTESAPAHADETFESDYDWKLAIIIPESIFGEGWTGNAEFVALSAMDNITTNANYSTVKQMKVYNGGHTTLRGAWCNKWVMTYRDKKGLAFTIR